MYVESANTFLCRRLNGPPPPTNKKYWQVGNSRKLEEIRHGVYVYTAMPIL